MRVWRYSPKDVALVGIAVAQLAATTAWALSFQRLSLAWNLVAFAVITYTFYYNPVVVTHNFLHTPFFRGRIPNRLFAILNSANLFLPQVLYKYHHLVHHQYANDPVRNGTTLDPSSTYRYGRNGRQEGFVRYCALSLFRDGTGNAYRESMRHGQRNQFAMELMAIVVVAAIWIAIDWRWMLFAYVPTFYFGWFLALLENYYEHHRASNQQDRLADSVSYYGRWYNVQRGIPSGTSPEAAPALDATSRRASRAPGPVPDGPRLRGATASPSGIPRLIGHVSAPLCPARSPINSLLSVRRSFSRTRLASMCCRS